MAEQCPAIKIVTSATQRLELRCENLAGHLGPHRVVTSERFGSPGAGPLLLHEWRGVTHSIPVLPGAITYIGRDVPSHHDAPACGTWDPSMREIL